MNDKKALADPRCANTGSEGQTIRLNDQKKEEPMNDILTPTNQIRDLAPAHTCTRPGCASQGFRVDTDEHACEARQTPSMIAVDVTVDYIAFHDGWFITFPASEGTDPITARCLSRAAADAANIAAALNADLNARNRREGREHA